MESSVEKQGLETGDKAFVTGRGQSIPFEQNNVRQCVQRQGILVDQPFVDGLPPTTKLFAAVDPPFQDDHPTIQPTIQPIPETSLATNCSPETCSERSPPLSRSAPSSTELSTESVDSTQEHFRSLEEALEKERRHSRESGRQIRELEEKLEEERRQSRELEEKLEEERRHSRELQKQVDLANCKLIELRVY